MLLKTALTLAAFYHVMATIAAMMGLFQLIRIARGEESFAPIWKNVFQWGELHLWISGLLLVGIGFSIMGMDYLNNPKLWCKVSLVTIWTINSFIIRRTLANASVSARNVMFGISAGSLIYGTVLGVAKPLAFGVVPFEAFLTGYFVTVVVSTFILARLMASKMKLATA